MFDTKAYQEQINQAIEFFKQKMAAVRTGRAHPSMLDEVKVEVYGALLPLNQTANIVAVDATLLQVTPFDINNLQAITNAIRSDQSLGFNPSDDGKIVRVPIPSLTEERRKEIVKQAGEKIEETKITIRNIRQDAFKDIKKLKTDKQISEDDAKRLEKQIQDTVDKSQLEIEEIFKAKEKEIMTV